MLTSTGSVSRLERRQDPNHAHKAPAEIPYRDAGANGFTSILAGNAHPAAGGLRDHVKTRPVFVGTDLPESSDAARNDLWVDIGQVCAVDP